MTGKKKKTLIFILFYATLFAFLTGCGLFSSDGDGDALALYPTTAKFVLYGNDFVPNDSAAAYLPTGTLLAVHPNALYTLSFDADSGRKPPKLRTWNMAEKYWAREMEIEDVMHEHDPSSPKNRKGRRRKRRSAKRKEENAARKQMIEDLASMSDT